MRVDDLAGGTVAAGTVAGGTVADSTATAGRTLGHRFVAALAARDAVTLRAMFDDEIDFRGMTPNRVWEARTPAAVVDDVMLGKWLEPDDVVERVEAVETAVVGGRFRVGYRLGVTNPGGRFVVEQQAFLDLADGKITWLRILCSGFHPVAGPP